MKGITMTALQTLWNSGRPAVNAWLSMPSSFGAEIIAAAEYDTVTIDWQHGIIGYADLPAMAQAIRAAGRMPMVRVPWLEPGAVMKALDLGALGVICPMISTPEDAAAFARYMRYPPRGTRSFGPTRAVIAHGSEYVASANDSVTALAMIETADGVANVEAIAATDGIDALYIGPSDLTIGYTNGALPPGLDRQEDEMIEVIHRIRDAAHNAGKKACIHCGSSDYAIQAIKWGFDMVTLINDVRILQLGAEASVAALRDTFDT